MALFALGPAEFATPDKRTRGRAMSTTTPDSPASTDRPPLRLPRGSVRALLTLMLVAVVCLEVARGHSLDALWTETLAIALAHYFTTRRFLDLTPEMIRRLKDEGVLPDEARPLYLPGFTVRGLILLAFLGLALFLQRHGRLGEPQSVSTLGLVGAYLLGTIAQRVRVRIFHGRHPLVRRVWEDLKAVATLAVMAFALVVYATGQADLLPSVWRDVTLGLALFYFGSR
jgi:hypothetical protein